MKKIIIPIFFTLNIFSSSFSKQTVKSELITKDKIKIKYLYAINPKEKAAILFLQGFNEFCKKWNETMTEFYNSGFSIYCYDHRGQGESTHLGSDYDVIHINNFDDYVSDLNLFINKVILPRKHSQLFSISHSMGAGILTKYLQKNSDVFSAALLSAPMHEIVIWNIPQPVTHFIAKTLSFIGLKKSVPFADKIGEEKDIFKIFEKQKMTHHYPRFQSNYEKLLKLEKNATSRPSFGWTLNSMKATVEMRKFAQNIKTPILMYQAGNDVLIGKNGQDEVCKKAKSCKKIVYPLAYHEIFNETDNIRDKAITNAKLYFNSFLKTM